MEHIKEKCPLCDAPIPIADLTANDGWFTCQNCKTEKQLLKYRKPMVRIPVYSLEQAAKILAHS